MPKSTAKKNEKCYNKEHVRELPEKGKVNPSLGDIPWSLRTAFNFYVPSGLPILRDLLCWWALEVHVYVGAPTA